MRRQLLTASLALLLLTAGSCGGDETDEVKRTISGYLTSVADRNGRAACSHLTKNGQLGVLEFKRAHIGADHPAEACAAVVDRPARQLSASRLRRPQIAKIEIDGDQASAKVDGFEVKLKREDADWRIDTFGLATDVGGKEAPATLQ